MDRALLGCMDDVCNLVVNMTLALGFSSMQVTAQQISRLTARKTAVNQGVWCLRLLGIVRSNISSPKMNSCRHAVSVTAMVLCHRDRKHWQRPHESP